MKSPRLNICHWLLVGAASTAVLPVSAAAIEEVTVTAQKREQDLQQVPVSVTAFTAEDQQRLQAHTLSDLQFATPGLYISPGRRSLAEIGLRGISDQTRNAGYDSRISVYLDGIYIGRSSGLVSLPLVDIEQVEVLHGPQGTLFGKNTVAGAINVLTTQPSEESFAELLVDNGSDDYRSLAARLNGTLIEDKLLGKLVVQQRERDGYIENLNPGADDDKLNGLDDELARGQLTWLVNDDLDVQFSMDYSRSIGPYVNGEGLSPIVAGGDKPYEVSIDADVESRLEQKGAGLQVDYQIDNQRKLTAITGLRQSTNRLVYDEDFSPADVASSDLNTRDRHHSQELRLTTTTDELQYVVGLYWLTQENVADNSAQTGALAPFLAGLHASRRVDYQAEVNVSSQALFGHATWSFAEQWELVTGLRFDHERKALDYVIDNTIQRLDGVYMFASGEAGDNRRRSSWSPKLGVNYHIDNNQMLFTSYSRSYKSGGWNTDYVESLNGMAFDDEQVDSIELGFKSSFADGTVQLNSTLYYSLYKDFQVFQFNGDSNVSSMVVDNAAEAKSQGLETSLQWQMTDELRWYLNHAWNETEFESFKDGDDAGSDFTGNVAPYAPKNTISLAVQHEYPLVGNLLLTTQADYHYRDTFYTHSNNTDQFRVDGYGIYNARIGVGADDQQWSAFLWVKNLTDEEEMQDQSLSFLQKHRASYTEPRSYGLSFRYRL